MSAQTHNTLAWCLVPVVGISSALAFVFTMNTTYPSHDNATGLATLFDARKRVEAAETTATAPASTQVVASDTGS